METGDGLLVRLHPVERRLSGGQLAGLARAARRFGNAVLEVTARGSLQIRGLTAESAPVLAAELEMLAVEVATGVPVEISPLAGIDALEMADPRPLAREIRKRIEAMSLSNTLAPKVSVTVDGGGAIGLGAIIADVKLEAAGPTTLLQRAPGWLVRVGGTSATARVFGCFEERVAADITIQLLEAVAQRGRTARAYDLSDQELQAIAPTAPIPNDRRLVPPRLPIGRFELIGGKQALGFVAAYGQMESDLLYEFAEAIGEHAELRLSPGRGLIVLDTAEREGDLLAKAETLGLVTRPDDPRLSIAVCAGRPACASAHLATKKLAEKLLARRPELLDGAFRLHLSGCEKQCARPSGPVVTLIGTENGHRISTEAAALSPELEALLTELAAEQRRQTV